MAMSGLKGCHATRYGVGLSLGPRCYGPSAQLLVSPPNTEPLLVI